jgi:hypothetical protein
MIQRALPLLLVLCLGSLLQAKPDEPEEGRYQVLASFAGHARVQFTQRNRLQVSISRGIRPLFQGLSSGSRSFVQESRRGASGVLRGAESERSVLTLRPEGQDWIGELVQGERKQTLRLRRLRRALVLRTTAETIKEQAWLWTYSNQVRSAYVRRGYSVTMVKVGTTEDVLTALARGQGNPFDRVAILGHAGPRDGIVFHHSYGVRAASRQVSPNDSHAVFWRGLVENVRHYTTRGAKIYVAGCNTGDYWAQHLARATDRVVAGPTDKTAWRDTRRLMLASLEGEGTVHQPILVAEGEQEFVIPKGRGLGDFDDEEAALREPGHGPGLRGFLREKAEGVRSRAVERRIQVHYGPLIDAVADSPEEADLMRAIVHEEQVHLTPAETSLESYGLGESVGPSQIRVDLWAKRYGTTREGLLDPQEHFRVMKLHLDQVRLQAVANGLPESPAGLGQTWNSMRAKGVGNYGQRVARYAARYADLRVAGS